MMLNIIESRQEHGWAGWPLYLMRAMIIVGLGLLIAAVIRRFGI